MLSEALNGTTLLHNNKRNSNKEQMWEFGTLSDCPYGSAGKEFACNVGDLGLTPGLGRTPGEGKGYRLQYSMNYTVYGAAKSQTQLSDFHFWSHILIFSFLAFSCSIFNFQRVGIIYLILT